MEMSKRSKLIPSLLKGCMLPHACIDHISQMYNLGLTGSAQRANTRNRLHTCTKVSDTYISTVAITELWVCSQKKINLGHKIVCPWEKTSHKKP